jgi:chitinase
LIIGLLVLVLVGTSTAAQPQAAQFLNYLPLIVSTQTSQPTSDYWVSAYYVGYQRDLYPPDQVDFSTLTHLIVGRIKPVGNGDVLTDFDIDPTNGPIMARTLATRAHQAGRKAILMLGGAGEHAGFVGAASPANRSLFVQNLLRVMDDLGYDGIDVDWEPIDTADRPNLLGLLQQLRAARPTMLLTIPVNWVNINFPDEVDSYYGQIAAVVDQINIMSYDMSSNYPGWDSWHFGPLYGATSTRPASIESSVQRYLLAGIAPRKLGIGIGFYGSCWKGVSAPKVPLDGLNVTMGQSDNVMTYARIVADYLPAATRIYDAEAKVPYLASAGGIGPQNCNFISYEDPESVAAKGSYVRGRGLGGAIIWTIGQGHIGSAPVGSRDPLMQAAKTAFLVP